MENRFLKYIKNMTRSRYDIFMEEYSDQHKYCPNCGSDSYIQTLVAYIFDENNPESYQNRNNAMCKCGFKHTIHDRLPKPPHLLDDDFWKNVTEIKSLNMTIKEDYYKSHKYCPNCGSEQYGSTLVAYMVNPNNMYYEDRNNATCECGFNHTINDRLPSPPPQS